MGLVLVAENQCSFTSNPPIEQLKLTIPLDLFSSPISLYPVILVANLLVIFLGVDALDFLWADKMALALL